MMNLSNLLCPVGLKGKDLKRFSQRGTTLVEVLVVIVIFLVGILAVVQIFPGGIRALTLARNAAVAATIAREESETLKANSDQLPDQVQAFYRNGTTDTPIILPGRSGTDISPLGGGLDISGQLWNGSYNSSWQLTSGPNVFRRIVAEAHRIPAPRTVGGDARYYNGGLVMLNFGPVNLPVDGTISDLTVYGNNLTREVVPPKALTQRGTSGIFDTTDSISDNEYFVVNPDQTGLAILLPTNPDPNPRTYIVSVSVVVSTGGNSFAKRDVSGVPITVPGGLAPSPTGLQPLAEVSIASVLSAGGVTGTLVSADLDSIKAARQFVPIANGDPFTDPYQYKVVNANLGALLFSPYAHSYYVASPTGRQPLRIRVDYEVYDWRVLRDDFRVVGSQYRLKVGGLKVGANAGPDGLPNGNIAPLESVPPGGQFDMSPANDASTDNFVLADLDTGGVYYEDIPGTTSPLIRVNKSIGLVSFTSADSSQPGIIQWLLLPDKSLKKVNIVGRAVRALYRVRNEFAVQVLKAASSYTFSTTLPLNAGQYTIGSSTRIYFPGMDLNRQVNIGEINYVAAGNIHKQLLGQDFVIRNVPADMNGPYIDLTDVDPNATAFDVNVGYPVRSVKGSTIAVRAFWNPETFHLGSNTSANMAALDQWARSWRITTIESYLQQGDALR